MTHEIAFKKRKKLCGINIIYFKLLNILGYNYPTAFHYYEANKVFALCGAQEANKVRQAGHTGEVRKAMRHAIRKVPHSVIEQWKRSEGLNVMRVSIEFSDNVTVGFGCIHKIIS